MNIIEAIKERRSVRSFNGEPLSDSLIKELLDFGKNVFNPFGGHYTIGLKKFNLKNGYRPSTYGMIKGANDFFVIAMAEDEISALATGFCFEQVVLHAWQLGLGTCWIAATFRSSDFETEEKWPDGETLRIVCPVGVASKKRIVEKIARATLGSRRRRPFEELFFNEDFNNPLSSDSRFGEALSMLRLAPSSKNSQPWRALVCGNTVHFYTIPLSEASVLDCGIGICHFYETEKFNGRTGRFHNSPIAPTHATWKYIVSYTV